MKKVFVQIPCLNEAATIESVINGIPKRIDGVDLQILIIDDGCTDDTVKIAKGLGVKHFVVHKKWMGLAHAFQDGINYSLEHGADIVVNTDGDNQYPQDRIPDLIKPILDGEADIVIGDRQTQEIAHFSPFKKLMQRFGSWVVNKAAGTDIPDAVSGFRAYSKDALLKINVVTQFTYTTETIVQAGNKRIPTTSIVIETNKKTRESRLFKNIWQHMYKSANAIIRSFIMYRPYTLFVSLSMMLGVAGLIPFVRYLVLTIADDSGNHLQSLLLGAVLLTGSFLALALGVLADLIRINRVLIEKQLEATKRSYTQK